MKSSTRRVVFAVAIGSAAVVVMLALALISDGSPLAPARVHAQSQAGSIVGAWTLNRDLSDIREGRTSGGDSKRRGGGSGRRGGGFGQGGRMGRGGRGGGGGEDMARARQAMRDIMDAPDHLTITQTESMVIITTGEGRTTRLSLDAKKIKDESTGIERKTKWEAGKLVTEITGPGGGKIAETYAVNPEERRLQVTIQVESSRMPQARTMNRVYDAEPR